MPASTTERRNQVVLGPLPESFLRLETRSSNGETVTTVTADPAIPRSAQVNLPFAQHQQQQHVQQQQQQHVQVVRPPHPTQTFATHAGLSITIAQAVLNKSYTLIGSMDPYVRLKVGHNTYETFTHGGADKNPRWNKVYHCPLPNTALRTINVEVFDEKSLTGDQRVAYAKINVPQAVFEGHTLDEWFPLSGKLGEGKEGTINLIISYTTIPMITQPYQRIHYPYMVTTPQHFTPRPPTPVNEADVDMLKDMFPDVEKEVLRAVLESKHGNVENTVSAVLQMADDTASR